MRAPQWSDIVLDVEEALNDKFNKNYKHTIPDDEGNLEVELTAAQRSKVISMQIFIKLVLVPEAIVRIVANKMDLTVNEVYFEDELFFFCH